MTNQIAWRQLDNGWRDSYQGFRKELPRGWKLLNDNEDALDVRDRFFNVINFDIETPKIHSQLLPGPNITYKFPRLIKSGGYIQEYHRKILDALRNGSEKWFVIFPDSETVYELNPLETDTEQEWPVPLVPGSKKVVILDPEINQGILISPNSNTACFFGGLYGFDRTRIPAVLKQSVVMMTG